MRSLIAAGVLLLAASVVACSDSVTEPELTDGPLLRGAPTILVTCVWPGEHVLGPALILKDPILPQDAANLPAYTKLCTEKGGHVVRKVKGRP
jgi:hypothetical protein